MNLPELFCPKIECPSRGQLGKANIIGHGKKKRRYKCTLCKGTFTQSACTALYRLHKDPQVFFTVVTLLSLGCPPQAAAVAFGLDARTLASWQQKAGEQAKRVHERLVLGQARDLGQVQADEIRVKMQKGIAWMAMAIAVPWRLWLGGVVSPTRDKSLIAALAALVHACALLRPLLICFDGFKSYVPCFHRAFRQAVKTGRRGRPPLLPWPCLCLGQVIKQYEKGRVVGVVGRLVQGAKEPVEALLFGVRVLGTAYIERLNATFRARLFALVRRGRCLLRQIPTLERSMYLVGTFYNFCSEHQSLRLACPEEGRMWQHRTPAMAAGITDHCWSLAELMTYRVPPPRWQPPKKRGRRSKEEQALIERWAT